MALYRSLGDLNEKTLEQVEREMRPDESFLIGASLAEAELGRFRTRFLVTDERLLTVKRGWIRKRTQSMPYSSITNTTTSESSMLELQIDAKGDISGEFLFSADEGREVVQSLREQITGSEAASVE